MLNHYILINTQTGETIKNTLNNVITFHSQKHALNFQETYNKQNFSIAKITHIPNIPQQPFPGPTKL